MLGFDINLIPLWFIAVLIIWTLPWKGIALWKSARNNQKIWFIIFLIVNTIGILEILYLVFWQKSRKAKARK